MDFTLKTEQLAAEEKAKKFAALEILPCVELLEHDLELRKDLFQKMAREGLFLMGVPKDLGGTQTDYLSYLLALKAISAADAGMGVAMAITTMMTEIIVRYGTSLQKEEYLTKIASGEGVPYSFALTEKDSGSDAKSLQTQAVLDVQNKNLYVLNGAKQFITNADLAGLILVMAKTDPDQGSRGVTAFLVDHGSKGLHIVKKERKLGLLSANLVDFRLENCKVPKNKILGELGQGFEIAMQALDTGRIGIAAQALGIAEAAYEAALKYSKERYQFGRALAENQAIAFKLADMYVKMQAGQALLYQACWRKEQGLDVNLQASSAKLFCTETAIEIVNDALQIFGGYGYIKDYPLERYYRDVRATTLYEGTSEIQRLIISRAILKERITC